MEVLPLVIINGLFMVALGAAVYLNIKTKKALAEVSRQKSSPKETFVIPRSDTSVDPMDPRGDGVIRSGDPMWDVFLAAMKDDGSAVIGNVQGDGSMKIEVYPINKDEKLD